MRKLDDLPVGAAVVVSNEELDGLDRHDCGARVLVRFDDDVAALGLHCHDPTANALYMFLDDLEMLEDAAGRAGSMTD